MSDTGWKSPTTAIGQWTNNNNALSEDGNFATLEAVGSFGINVIPWTDEITSVGGYTLTNNVWGDSNAFMEILGFDWGHNPPLELDQLDSLYIELEEEETMSILAVSGFDFSGIPSGSTINGLDIRVKGYKSGDIFYVDVVQAKIYYTDSTTPIVGEKYPLPPFRRS